MKAISTITVVRMNTAVATKKLQFASTQFLCCFYIFPTVLRHNLQLRNSNLFAHYCMCL